MARRVIATTLTADAPVTAFLDVLGLALWACLHGNPHLIPHGQTLVSDADEVFPQLIVLGDYGRLCRPVPC